MDSASLQFVLFGLTAALISNLSPSRGWRSVVLLLTSIGFLALLTHHVFVLFPLMGFLLLGYLGLILIERGWSQAAVWSILAVILAYVWLKKYTFLPHTVFLRWSYFTLGLSYIFFRVLHLLIEAADAPEKRRIGVGPYLLYTLNFTTLVSGPIQRYDDFAADQFAQQPASLGPRVIGLQLERIVRGFFKVNVLALLLDMVRIGAFTQMSQPLSVESKLFAAFRLAVAYPLFLYANFSGYIDIVIAVARLMRVQLPENFNRPFAASSFLDFWNRWHITLSTWLKTYVYNPLLLALTRRVQSVPLQPLIGVFCFFVTFFLVGIWHGRTSEFVVFGVLQGAGVAINKLWQLGLARAFGRKRYKVMATTGLYVFLGRGLTFSWFAFTMLWFWGNWKQIHEVIAALDPAGWFGAWVAIWLCASSVLALWERMREALLSVKIADTPVVLSRYARAVYCSAMGLAALITTVLLSQPAPELVYKLF